MKIRRSLTVLSAALAAALIATASMSAQTAHATPESPQGIATTLYAAPGGTGDECSESSPCALNTAREQVRELTSGMTGDILVYLRGGTYTLSSTINFDVADSGANGHNIMYRAYPGETPVISGGQPVTGWTVHDTTKNIYQANVGSEGFRQLYVDGRPGVTARYPNLTEPSTGGPYLRMTNGYSYPFQINAADIGDWADDPDVEFRWLAHWTNNIANVDHYTVDGPTATVYFQSPEDQYWSLTHHTQDNANYYWQNSYALLDAPGEWFHDKSAGTLYYIPRDGEDLSTADVQRPVVQTLFDLTGEDVDAALSKPAAASGANTANPPSNAVDGSTTSSADNSMWEADSPGDKWLTVDLGEQTRIDRWIVKHAEYGGLSSELNTRDFRLQTSPDGQEWTDTDAVSGNKDPVTARPINVTARYFRLYVTAPTSTTDTAARIFALELHHYTPVSNIQFNGLNFQYSNWDSPSDLGYYSGQASIYTENSAKTAGPNGKGWTPVPAMVQLRTTANIKIERSTFRYAGANALASYLESAHNTFVGNTIRTIAGGGIYVGVGDYWSDAAPNGASAFDTITNNYIAYTGLDYRDSVGIFASFPTNMTITKNELANMPYSGISIGFAWNDRDGRFTRDNTISYNKIHKVMTALDDGGGIYTLGKMPDTLIEGNYVFNLPPSQWQGNANFGRPNAGIYLDNGSAYKSVDSNVINNAASAVIAINPPNHDNVISNNFYNAPLNKIAPTNTLDNNNMVAGQDWPAEAQAIMNGAGIDAAYADIIPADNDLGVGERFTGVGGYLASGSYITQDAWIKAPFGGSFLYMGGDGNLCLYAGTGPSDNHGVVWCSSSGGAIGKYFAMMQTDGNLVIYKGTGPTDNQGSVWSSSNGGESGTYMLQVGDDQALTIFKGSDPQAPESIVWTTRTPGGAGYLLQNEHVSTNVPVVSPSSTSFMDLGSDGNLCLYHGSGPSNNGGPVWCSDTAGPTGDYFMTMQSDCNLVIYKGTGPADNRGVVWASATSSSTGCYLAVQDDQTLVIHEGIDPSHDLGPLWSTEGLETQQDVVPPELEVTADPAVLTTPNNKWQSVKFKLDATDDSGSVAVELVKAEATGPKAKAEILSSTEARVLARNKATYTFLFEATDPSGNVTTEEVNVPVKP